MELNPNDLQRYARMGALEQAIRAVQVFPDILPDLIAAARKQLRESSKEGAFTRLLMHRVRLMTPKPRKPRTRRSTPKVVQPRAPRDGRSYWSPARRAAHSQRMVETWRLRRRRASDERRKW